MSEVKPASATPKALLLKIIWAALLLSTFMYLALAFNMFAGSGRSLSETAFEFSSTAEQALFSVAIICFVMAHVVPSILLKGPRMRFQQMIQQGVETEIPLETLASAFTVPLIVRLALLEATILMGFVMSLFAHDPNKMLPLFSLGFLGFMAHYPSAIRIKSSLGFTK